MVTVGEIEIIVAASEKDQLIELLFYALDDEVRFCIDSYNGISETSTELLEECERRKIGKSKALETLRKRKEKE